MKILLIIILTSFFSILHSQTVNGLELKDLDVNYLRIYGRANFTGTKMVVRFEFGQRVRFFDSKNRNVTDKDGKIITFNTMIDALNFISAYGYRLVQSYNTISGSTVYYHYIMEKIGLINNQGINKYSNNQNNHFNRMNDDKENKENIKKKEEEDVKSEKYSAEKQAAFEAYLKEKERKEAQDSKVELKKTKGESGLEKKLDKVDDFISNIGKKKNTDEKDQEKPKFESCSDCKGTGAVSETCTDKDCNSGTISKTCTSCSGKYSDGADECYKCEGKGCEYCDYDGKACGSCKKGIKKVKHAACNGTGKISKPCQVCGGKGQLSK